MRALGRPDKAHESAQAKGIRRNVEVAIKMTALVHTDPWFWGSWNREENSTALIEVELARSGSVTLSCEPLTATPEVVERRDQLNASSSTPNRSAEAAFTSRNRLGVARRDKSASRKMQMDDRDAGGFAPKAWSVGLSTAICPFSQWQSNRLQSPGRYHDSETGLATRPGKHRLENRFSSARSNGFLANLLIYMVGAPGLESETR
ncbi:hypothetical protein IVB12_16380 [Bradyrhizobium sp. 179]|uniref:hypothetical protein n=1 Tax=Bradyrhizobium sp. 179 TaxID=2782648 RepID=UPI001FF9DD5F|nr:hypothetical protein [Bradyrhizobium sp. 179]MCK1543491.1 hypothetical protein [Bradyrhizobium sp. 179]